MFRLAFCLGFQHPYANHEIRSARLDDMHAVCQGRPSAAGRYSQHRLLQTIANKRPLSFAGYQHQRKLPIFQLLRNVTQTTRRSLPAKNLPQAIAATESAG